jgi:hypothetical protein
VLLLVLTVISALPSFFGSGAAHWGGYPVILVYLGGLFILFVYVSALAPLPTISAPVSLYFGFLLRLLFWGRERAFLHRREVRREGLYALIPPSNTLPLGVVFTVLLLLLFITKEKLPLSPIRKV